MASFSHPLLIESPISIYDLALTVRVSWQAHSLSTAGSNGTNRVMPRQQMLANGQETDACSGNIAKHHHSMLLAEYMEASKVPLCPACCVRDARRIAALMDRPEYKEAKIEQILQNCGLCDAHGFLVTAKRPKRQEKQKKQGGENGEESENEEAEEQEDIRLRRSKHTLVNFSFALALPDRHAMTQQTYTRIADSKEEGQMLMKMPTRSGDYALQIRYHCVGVGVDTDKWQVAITNQQQRILRHVAILSALRDSLLSPDGAMTATMLPHLTGLQGAVVVRQVGRAPLYSGLVDDFVAHLQALEDETCQVYPFETVESFHSVMNGLIKHSSPAFPAAYQNQMSLEVERDEEHT